jgi:HlyD family secretion protein
MMADQRDGSWHLGVPLSAKWPVIVGLAILFVWGGGFGVWAALAPLHGAVVAPGTFVATGQNKLVQHLEGGIVREISVGEGDLVAAGQTLVRMDETSARAKLRRLVLKNYRLAAMKARLETEMEGRDEMEIPPTLAARQDDPEVRAIIARHRSELRARRTSLVTEELVLDKEIAGIRESIQGYEAQVRSTKQRIAMFAEELKDKSALLKKHLTRKTEVLDLQRAEAGLVGNLGELVGRIADSHQRIARANQHIAHLRSEAVRAAIEELRQVEAEIDDVQEQIHAAQDVVDRAEVQAPTRGIVVRLHYHTPGAVVAPGGMIVELLPVNDELIIEAQVKPSDVTHVAIGQEALVRLSALNRRVTPTIAANVIYLSADALREQMPSMERGAGSARGMGTRQDYYVVRVRLDEADVFRRLEAFQPTPGMPAEVYIKTGERTFFEYVMRPVFDSFSHAFREN